MLSNRYKKLSPYVAGEQPKDKKYIKLNTNENAYDPSLKVKEAIANFQIDRLKLYPDPNFMELRESIAEVNGVHWSNVFVGNGSDEVLSFIFFAFFGNENGKLLFPEYTYSFYPVYCDFYGIDYFKVGMNDKFEIDLNDYRFEDSCGVIFPNPNAPTAIALKSDKIEAFLKSYPKNRIVVIDEAYIDFAEKDESSLALLKKHKNLIIVRTFSKGYSLAGMRLGYVLADETLIEALFNTKDSFNSYPCDVMSQVIGKAAIEDVSYYNYINSEIVKTRDSFSKDLITLGWRVLPSSANFIFASHPSKSGKDIYTFLRENGILVRYFDKDGLRDFVRITIGSNQQMSLLKRVLWELGK